MPPLDRFLIHLAEFRRVPIDPSKVFFLEADGDETLLRTHRKQALHDIRMSGNVNALHSQQRHTNVDSVQQTPILPPEDAGLSMPGRVELGIRAGAGVSTVTTL